MYFWQQGILDKTETEKGKVRYENSDRNNLNTHRAGVED